MPAFEQLPNDRVPTPRESGGYDVIAHSATQILVVATTTATMSWILSIVFLLAIRTLIVCAWILSE